MCALRGVVRIAVEDCVLSLAAEAGGAALRLLDSAAARARGADVREVSEEGRGRGWARERERDGGRGGQREWKRENLQRGTRTVRFWSNSPQERS